MAKQNQQIVIGLAAAAIASTLLWYAYKQRSDSKSIPGGPKDSASEAKAASKSRDLPSKSNPKGTVSFDAPTPTKSNTSDEKMLNLKIEELDKKGKTFFKKKQYLEAAQVFTEALDLIDAQGGAQGSSTLVRQVVTLLNNRSAMYEKAGLPDLALEDCATILDMDVGHIKARTRKLRVLESQGKYPDALIEVCAIQLKFMKDNRDKLRMGIPVQPPIPQNKLEEFIQMLLPPEIEKYLAVTANSKVERPLPSDHTLSQLLKSFQGYNSWMAKAGRDGTVDSLSTQLAEAETDAAKATLLMKRGRRHAYDQNFQESARDFDAGYLLVNKKPEVQEAMEEDAYARLMEWAGMAKHWKYDLDGATKCYEIVSDLEPMNAGILVKQAGVKMDGGKHDEALALFDTALGLDCETTDALLHRANLRMMQQKIPEAKADLERCLEIRPDHVLALLRLATIFMSMNDMEGAKRHLNIAERIDPNSSEVHSYRGEMYFAENDIASALLEFSKAIEAEPNNPAAYVNSALAMLNMQPAPGEMPDVHGAIKLLEQAVAVDPQFHAAYVHLGQLKLSLATDLSEAEKVIKLYDQGLKYCRTADEIKDIVSMRLLTVAQHSAAKLLKMESFNMQ
jgi:mitochondrial import receptor subunit TOM70